MNSLVLSILIGVAIGAMVILVAVVYVSLKLRYTKKHLGETRIRTNGDKFIAEQYGYRTRITSCDYEMKFFYQRGTEPDWYSIKKNGYSTDELATFDSLAEAQDVCKIAQDNFRQHKRDSQPVF